MNQPEPGHQPPSSVTHPEFTPETPLAEHSLASLQRPDWRWQMSNRLTSVAALSGRFPGFVPPPDQVQVESRYPFAITPYYLSLIEAADDNDPIFRMAIPQAIELQEAPALLRDPLGEEKHNPVPGMFHRYPDRVVLVMNGLCPVYCRYCFRKRFVGIETGAASTPQLDGWVQYLTDNPQIKDVILSGGDPLTLGTAKLRRYLTALRDIPSVEIIRIHTRIPVLLPMRIDDELVQMLREFQPLWMVTHFNHPRELTELAAASCAKLIDAGIPLNNQSVLLRGVNDHPDILEALCRKLVMQRIRPYYLHQCDLMQGIEHLRTPISRGIEMMEALRGRLGGLAIPQYVVDLPQGGGKVPLLPQYIISQSPETTVLRNFEGRIVPYPEPQHQPRTGPTPRARGGVSDRLTGVAPEALLPQK